ncbi:MAG: hypothetical protein HY791_31490 [Deltaproteobacteria bacterium]|nr:hypothetical protein [Deltaproteobacteria bacterium]
MKARTFLISFSAAWVACTDATDTRSLKDAEVEDSRAADGWAVDGAGIPDAGTPWTDASRDGDVGPPADSGPDGGFPFDPLCPPERPPSAREDSGVSTERPDGGPFSGNCVGCRFDGETCVFSINCAPGSICNEATEELYDPAQPLGVCIRVVCTSDDECDSPRVCAMSRLCELPECARGSDCATGVCAFGTCHAVADPSSVASCVLIGGAAAVSVGHTLLLAAIAFDGYGRPLGNAPFELTSSDPLVVATAGSVVSAATGVGYARVTASSGSVSCSGEVFVHNVGADEGMVIVDADSGRPVFGAAVSIFAAGAEERTSDANGRVPIDGRPTSITVVADGFVKLSILAPPAGSLVVPLRALADPTQVAAVSAFVDVSAIRRSDVGIVVGGPSLDERTAGFGLSSLICDGREAAIQAPELGLEGDPVPMSDSLAWSLGSNQLTASRCGCRAPGIGEVGCVLGEGRVGSTFAWAMGARIRLSRLTSIAGRLSLLLGGGEPEPACPASWLTSYLPLVGAEGAVGLGATAALEAHARVARRAGVDCSDSDRVDYRSDCGADAASARRVVVTAKGELRSKHVVRVPQLPSDPSGGCASSVLGLVLERVGPALSAPIGMGMATDDPEAPDCVVDGVEEPFGSQSAPISDGSLAIFSTSASHEEDEVLALYAVDSTRLVPGREKVSVVFRADFRSSPTGPNFLAYPSSTFDSTTGSLRFDSAPAASTVRWEIRRGQELWQLYAPGGATEYLAPDVAAARAVLGSGVSVRVETIEETEGYQGRFAAMGWTERRPSAVASVGCRPTASQSRCE